MSFVLVGVCCTENECGGADGDDATLREPYAVVVAQDAVHVEGSRIAGCIAQDVLQVSALVTLYANDAMLCVHARIDRIDGAVDGCAQYFATEDVVAHVQGYDLFEMEYVLYDHDAALFLCILLLVEYLLALGGSQFAYPQANGKLLSAVLTLEDQLLTLGVLCLIEGDERLAFGASDSFHNYSKFRIQALSMSACAAFRAARASCAAFWVV